MTIFEIMLKIDPRKDPFFFDIQSVLNSWPNDRYQQCHQTLETLKIQWKRSDFSPVCLSVRLNYGNVPQIIDFNLNKTH